MRRSRKALAACLLLAALLPQALAHRAEIADGGANRYKALALTPEIYARAASPDLSDLRLTDAAGRPVAYFIHSGEQTRDDETVIYPMANTAFMEQDSFEVFDFEVQQTAPLTDVLATSISFSTDADAFAARISLLGSLDGQHWQSICEDTLYRVDGHEKLELAFGQPLRYTYYRLRVPRAAEHLLLNGASLQFSVEREQTALLTKEFTPIFSVRTEGKETMLTLKGLKNLRLTALALETDSMFQRNVSCALGEKRLYRLTFGDTAYADTTLPLGGEPYTSDSLTLTIANGDDLPINLRSVTVQYRADELIFEGGNPPYTLTFGEAQPAPQYDIASYREQVLAQPLDRLTVGAVSVSAPAVPASPAPVKPRDWTLFFNLAILAAATLLVVVILRLIQQNPNKK